VALPRVTERSWLAAGANGINRFTIAPSDPAGREVVITLP
jgi:hypothetical protein